jgi:hypothetical protein
MNIDIINAILISAKSKLNEISKLTTEHQELMGKLIPVENKFKEYASNKFNLENSDAINLGNCLVTTVSNVTVDWENMIIMVASQNPRPAPRFGKINFKINISDAVNDIV